MIANNMEKIKWSDKKMEGNDGMRIVESLRGRLLAERQASRVANENAQLMGNMLIELEGKLSKERELREKAKKKLKFLMKKLNSLDISSSSMNSEHSGSSESYEISMSSTSTKAHKDQEEDDFKSQATDSILVPLIKLENVSESSTPSAQGCENSIFNSNTKHNFLEKSCNDHSHSSLSLKSAMAENGDDHKDGIGIGNSLALCLLNLQETSISRELKPVH